MKNIFSIGAALFFLASCSGFEQRRQPGPPPVKPPSAYVKPEMDVVSDLERDVWRPKSAVWKKFMLAVSRTNFYIGHVDEAKGELQVHYSGDPQNYVDCGRVASSVKLPEGEKNYDFPAASPYQQYQVIRKGKVYQVERRMGLTAAVRMIFSEAEPEKTRINATSSYTLTRDQSVVGGANSKPLLLNDSIGFNTGETGTFPNAQTKCQPTGKLEADLLGLLK